MTDTTTPAPPSWFGSHVLPLLGVVVTLCGFIGYVITTTDVAALATGGGLMATGGALLWSAVKAIIARNRD
jgi:hypothetical protein